MNSRMDALQAVILSAKLRRLDRWNASRRTAAEHYRDLFADVAAVVPPASHPGSIDVWHLYVVQLADRERALDALTAAGIGAAIHYPTPLHLTAAYAGLGYRAGQFPVAEAAAGRILSLPMFPHISTDQQTYVVDSLVGAL